MTHAAASSPLVIFHKQLGDTVLMEPALAKLAAATGQPVTFAARPGFGPLISLMEDVRPASQCWPRRASSVISFEYRPRACIYALGTLSAEKRLLVASPHHLKPWHKLLFPAGRRVAKPEEVYRAEFYFRIMPGESKMAYRPPRLKPPPVDWMPAGLPADYVLLHATSAWKRKSWTPRAWGELLNALDDLGYGPFVVTGGAAEWERDYVRDIQAHSKPILVDLCGHTDLRAYLAVIANARALICIDGSSSHIAAALNVPAVTLFGPSHPVHWHTPSPISVAVDAREFCTERKPSAAVIPAAAVRDAFVQMLHRQS